MARPITNKIMTELSVAATVTSRTAGQIYFHYEEVVEAIRNSPFAYRFDFEKYDAERAAGHKSTDLYFNFKDKETGTIYNYPTYRKTSLHLRRFILSYRKNRALPRIESLRYYCRYTTIEQLLAMLAIVVPKIDELEKGILEDEQKDIRKSRVQEIFSSTVPDLVKSMFADTGLGYWYEMRRDCIFLQTRLPMKLCASFTIKFKDLGIGIQRAITSTKEISEIIESNGDVIIDKFTDKYKQWTEG